MQDHKKVIIKKRFLIAAGVFAAIFCVLACFVLLYQKGFFLPEWITWNEKEEVFSDGFEFVLSDSKLSFIGSENGEKIPVYEFDDKLKFSDFLIYDVDGDGDRELVTLLWKQGIYGTAKPFWQKDNRIKWSQHIFIYDVVPDDKGNPIAQKWCTSQLGRLVKRWRVLDESENIKLSKNPNIGTLLLEDANDKITLWAWKSWGLKNYDSSVSFVSVGDNIIHKDILEYGLYQKGGNFDFLYQKYKEEIQNADISTVNLESILVDDPEFYSAYPYFGSPLEVGDALVKNGFDVITCANNHSLDKSTYGLKTTYDYFADMDAYCLGIAQNNDETDASYVKIVKNGISFALYNYTYGTNASDRNDRTSDMDKDRLQSARGYNVYDLRNISKQKLKEDLIKGKEACDISIVFVHWGDEYSNQVNEYQKEYAGLFNECGVDVIIGTHPHVLQPMEMYEGQNGHNTLVYYSLGNFVASQNDEQTREGGMAHFTVEYTFDGIGISDYSMEKIDSYWR